MGGIWTIRGFGRYAEWWGEEGGVGETSGKGNEESAETIPNMLPVA